MDRKEQIEKIHSFYNKRRQKYPCLTFIWNFMERLDRTDPHWGHSSW